MLTLFLDGGYSAEGFLTTFSLGIIIRAAANAMITTLVRTNHNTGDTVENTCVMENTTIIQKKRNCTIRCLIWNLMAAF